MGKNADFVEEMRILGINAETWIRESTVLD